MKRAESVQPASLLACRTNKLVYLNVPKSACTTIKNIMYYLDWNEYPADPFSIHRQKFALLRPETRPNQFARKFRKECFLFTFIREPKKRAYSCFMDKVQNQSSRHFEPVRQYLTENYGMRIGTGDPLEIDLHRENFRSFLRFVRDNEAGKTEIRRNNHWAPQSRIVSSAPREVELSYIGVVENLAQQFREIMKLANIDKELNEIPRFNESNYSAKVIEQVIDDEIDELLKEVYSDDYLLYERVSRNTQPVQRSQD
jgi:hypothetical protein